MLLCYFIGIATTVCVPRLHRSITGGQTFDVDPSKGNTSSRTGHRLRRANHAPKNHRRCSCSVHPQLQNHCFGVRRQHVQSAGSAPLRLGSLGIGHQQSQLPCVWLVPSPQHLGCSIQAILGKIFPGTKILEIELNCSAPPVMHVVHQVESAPGRHLRREHGLGCM